MDPLNLLVGVAILVALILGYIAWKARKNGVSVTDELKLLRPAIADHVTALTGHALSLETHAEAIKQAVQPNVPGVTIDPQPNTIVIRHEFAPPPPAAPPPVATADPVDTFLGNDTSTPKAPLLRNEDAEGPMISQYIADHHVELANEFTRVNRAYCRSMTLSPEDACKLVANNEDLEGRDAELAAGQRLRDEQANIAGVDFKGHVDVARLTLEDGFYLSAMAGRFAALTGQGSIWTAMLYGSATACNAFINMINSTNAGRLGTYDPNTYQGQMKALVEAKIGGLT